MPLYGLGNVMFQYAFLCELRKRTNEACCFFVYRKSLFDHNGYELDKLLDVQPYKGLNIIQRIYITFLEFLGTLKLPNFFLLRPFFRVIRLGGEDSFIYYDSVFSYPNKNVLFWGMWQSPKYFLHAKQEILDTYKFDRSMISQYSKEVLYKIEHLNSVCIHLRRGDYMNDQYKGGFSRCCPPEYYESAIRHIESQIENPVYFVFSDDIEYAKSVIKVRNVFFVDGNKKEDAWQDMFLMSCCQHNIIANSTFSWWGAFLNSHDNKIVIAPKRWWYYLEKDDIVPEDWMRL